MIGLIVDDYHYEPYSASIWRLKIPALDMIIQCIEPLGRDHGDIKKGTLTTGKLILEMAQVKILADTQMPPRFSIVKENFNLSDGSRARCIGRAGNIQQADNKFDLSSVLEFSVQAEILPEIYEDCIVEVIGILKFEPYF